MNTFKDYGELQQNIVDWVDRQDIEDKVPGFIRLITVDMSRFLRIPTMISSTVVDMYADGSAKVPPDLIEIKSVNLLDVDSTGSIKASYSLGRGSIYKYEESRNPELSKSDSKPTKFTTSGDKIYIYPLNYSKDKITNNSTNNTDKAGKLEVTYYRLPITINEDNEYNWILEIAPEIYFYGGLMHSYRYVRDLEGAQYWEVQYEKAVKKLQDSVDVAEWAGGPITVE